jgi:transposase InsO family protein
MRKQGLRVPQRRIPRGRHDGRIETSRCDEVWATDLSKIATHEGWLWIVGVIDCHDRDLIGHRYGVTADTTLCLGQCDQSRLLYPRATRSRLVIGVLAICCASHVTTSSKSRV